METLLALGRDGFARIMRAILNSVDATRRGLGDPCASDEDYRLISRFGAINAAAGPEGSWSRERNFIASLWKSAPGCGNLHSVIEPTRWSVQNDWERNAR